MKKIIMLMPECCGAGDTYKFGIYEVIKDKLYNGEEDKETDYTEENKAKYPRFDRWIIIKDESSQDEFQVYENEDRFILCENEKELAHALINLVDGLAETIVNMATTFIKCG